MTVQGSRSVLRQHRARHHGDRAEFVILPVPRDFLLIQEGAQNGLCSGNMGVGMDGADTGPTAVVDTIVLPEDLAPGAYVLGWRLDCEATAQVWTNCADVTIAAA